MGIGTSIGGEESEQLFEEAHRVPLGTYVKLWQDIPLLCSGGWQLLDVK